MVAPLPRRRELRPRDEGGVEPLQGDEKEPLRRELPHQAEERLGAHRVAVEAEEDGEGARPLRDVGEETEGDLDRDGILEIALGRSHRREDSGSRG